MAIQAIIVKALAPVVIQGAAKLFKKTVAKKDIEEKVAKVASKRKTLVVLAIGVFAGFVSQYVGIDAVSTDDGVEIGFDINLDGDNDFSINIDDDTINGGNDLVE